MKNSSWLKFIHTSNSANAIREIFNKTYGLIDRDDVFELFMNRIEYLMEQNSLRNSRVDLDALKEDIEDERELLGRIKIKKEQLELKRALAQANQEDITEVPKVRKFFGTEIIREIKFEGYQDLIYKAEKELIVKSLEALEDNRTQAAKVLGISIRTLRNKLNEYAKEARNAELGLLNTPNFRQEAEFEV